MLTVSVYRGFPAMMIVPAIALDLTADGEVAQHPRLEEFAS
jgi:hypothetical protein